MTKNMNETLHNEYTFHNKQKHSKGMKHNTTNAHFIINKKHYRINETFHNLLKKYRL